MNKKLESIRMLSIVINAMIGIELITMPSSAVKYAKNDAWLSPLIIGAIILLNTQQGFWVCKQYPELNYAQIMEKLYGRFLGKVFILVNIIYNIYINGISIRLFSESVSMFLLDQTPVIIILIATMSIVTYCILMDFETISIVFDILLPIILLFILLLIIIALTAITPYNLYPPMYKGVLPVLKGSISSLNPAAAAFVFAFLLPMFKAPQATKKYVNLGIIVSTIIYSVFVALCIMVFGAEEINYLTFPTLTLSKAIQLNSEVFERAESLFMAAWIPNSITTFIVYFLISTISTKAFFNTKKDALVKLAQLPFIFIIALLPRNNVEVFKMLEWANNGIILLAFLYVPMVTLTAFFKKGRAK
ncbi:GerAB/ArcD/ProY family transporter [Clostridium magnum]|uniref:Spore germination protein YndE n=1 Tax=Clostridium magnum DSM 2767 TaxID=1121326 RepID=A0A162RT40_9CLOT|nr:GerAB/ArcD/ProY family transporter [Clostridium magnum]KZL90340.1 spore germination protein YndE [Clostridium magnum DSM 2767]SHH82516.1 spore germination protein (amino acid permease) [Clostridium magnum DSM 2767]